MTTRKIRINEDREGLQFEHQPLEAGEVYELPEGFAKQLVAGRRATWVGEDAPDPDLIPDDFPHAAELRRIGLRRYAELAPIDDLTRLPGIGDAKAGDIRQALEARSADAR